MRSILIVCEGNVCRSPYVERVLRARLADAGVTDVAVTSAGTRARAGQPMVRRSAHAVLAAGADPNGFASTPLSARLLAGADLVVVLEREHRAAVLDIAPALLRRTFTLREFARLAAPLQSVVPGPGGADDLWDRVPGLLAANRRPAPVDHDDDIADPVRGDDAEHEAFRARSAAGIAALVAFAARASHSERVAA